MTSFPGTQNRMSERKKRRRTMTNKKMTRRRRKIEKKKRRNEEKEEGELYHGETWQMLLQTDDPSQDHLS